jgi:D-serine deaminase-like pyridoxal phosphate-dependent protein
LRKRLAELLLEVGLFEARLIDTEVVQRRDEVAARLTAAGLEAFGVLAKEPDDPDATRILAWTLLARLELDSLPDLPPGVESVGAAVQRRAVRQRFDRPRSQRHSQFLSPW